MGVNRRIYYNNKLLTKENYIFANLKNQKNL
jgi:hypothetical protein